MQTTLKTTAFNTKRSIRKENSNHSINKKWDLIADGLTYSWSNSFDRVRLIREGIPYESIEFIAKQINCSVKTILELVGIPQTTYNKKKGSHSKLDNRHSELVLKTLELIDYGFEVFNHEDEKFQGWLKTQNITLGNEMPLNFLDTISGIDEVRNCLNRIEFGNFA